MAIYQITGNKLEKVTETSFSAQGIRVRADLQMLFRAENGIISANFKSAVKETPFYRRKRKRQRIIGIKRMYNSSF